jgi:hypothetical protein
LTQKEEDETNYGSSDDCDIDHPAPLWRLQTVASGDDEGQIAYGVDDYEKGHKG